MRPYPKQRRFLGAERVERDHHQHAVAGRRVDLGVGDQRIVVHAVEMDRTQLLQCGVQAANCVELRDEWLERASFGERAREVTGPQLVLLGVQVFLAALPHRTVLEQFVA